MSLILTILMLLLMPMVGWAQLPLTVTEADGSPTRSNVGKIVFPNGSVTINGQTATISFAGAGLLSGSGLTANSIPKA